MAMKLGQKKFEKSTSTRQVWKSLAVSCNVQVWSISLVGACSVGVLLFCFIFVDMRGFVSKTIQLGFGLDPNHHLPEMVSDSAAYGVEDPPLTTTRTNLTNPRDAPLNAAHDATTTLHELDENGWESLSISHEEQQPTSLLLEANLSESANVSATTNRETLTALTSKNQQQHERATDLNIANANDYDATTGATEVVAEDDDDDDIRSELRKKKREKKQKSKRTNTPSPSDCNISEGKWVYDDSYPLYRSKNCPFADPGFRCEENGRPDLDYLKYRWQPHECDLPRFNATETLERLRNQRMVFVGDSIGRNHWESMLCMLAEAVKNKTRIYEVNGETISKHTGFLSFRFEDYNLTVEYFREPFLIPQTRPPPNSHPNVTCALVVDFPCWSFSKWIHADILVFNAGHWWTQQKIRNQGCFFQKGNKIDMDMDLETGFRKSMQTLGTWMDAQLSPKTQVFFRSFASVHFRGAAWNAGGHCHEEVRPLTEEEARAEWATPWTNKIMMTEVRHNMKRKDSVTYIDVTTGTNYRSDAHSGLYYRDNSVTKTPTNKQDCSHFCLPGVPDTWNELLVASLLSKGKGTWGQQQPIKF